MGCRRSHEGNPRHHSILGSATRAAARAGNTRCRTGFEELPGAFVQTIEPVLRLILMGDSSDTHALRAQATLLGWDVLLFEAGPVTAEVLDDRTAVVIATHNFGRDCAILRDLLPAGL